jgi:hypothetical protein
MRFKIYALFFKPTRVSLYAARKFFSFAFGRQKSKKMVVEASHKLFVRVDKNGA